MQMNIEVVDYFIASQYTSGFWHTIAAHQDPTKHFLGVVDHVKDFLEKLQSDIPLYATDNIITLIHQFCPKIQIMPYPESLDGISDNVDENPRWFIAADMQSKSLIGCLLKKGTTNVPQSTQIIFNQNQSINISEPLVDLRPLPFSAAQKQLLYLIACLLCSQAPFEAIIQGCDAVA